MPPLCESAARPSRGSGVILWIDAQLSPALVLWIRETFHIEAYAVRDLGLRDAKDPSYLQSRTDCWRGGHE